MENCQRVAIGSKQKQQLAALTLRNIDVQKIGLNSYHGQVNCQMLASKLGKSFVKYPSLSSKEYNKELPLFCFQPTF